jgi:hypothetical protein
MKTRTGIAAAWACVLALAGGCSAPGQPTEGAKPEPPATKAGGVEKGEVLEAPPPPPGAKKAP